MPFSQEGSNLSFLPRLITFYFPRSIQIQAVSNILVTLYSWENLLPICTFTWSCTEHALQFENHVIVKTVFTPCHLIPHPLINLPLAASLCITVVTRQRGQFNNLDRKIERLFFVGWWPPKRLILFIEHSILSRHSHVYSTIAQFQVISAVLVLDKQCLVGRSAGKTEWEHRSPEISHFILLRKPQELHLLTKCISK